MADKQTSDLLDLYGLRERVAYFEQKERDRVELARLAHLAKVRFGHEVRTPDSDPDYIHRPLEMRVKWEREIGVIEKEEREKQAAKDRDAERQRRYREFLAQKESAERLEEERVAGNIRNFGDVRPENSESFTALPLAMRSRLVAMFGPGFISELATKSKSGLTWAQWDKLKNLDPNPTQAASNGNAAAETPSTEEPSKKD